jgi:hypothetical protein
VAKSLMLSLVKRCALVCTAILACGATASPIDFIAPIASRSQSFDSLAPNKINPEYFQKIDRELKQIRSPRASRGAAATSAADKMAFLILETNLYSRYQNAADNMVLFQSKLIQEMNNFDRLICSKGSCDSEIIGANVDTWIRAMAIDFSHSLQHSLDGLDPRVSHYRPSPEPLHLQSDDLYFFQVSPDFSEVTPIKVREEMQRKDETNYHIVYTGLIGAEGKELCRLEVPRVMPRSAANHLSRLQYFRKIHARILAEKCHLFEHSQVWSLHSIAAKFCSSPECVHYIQKVDEDLVEGFIFFRDMLKRKRFSLAASPDDPQLFLYPSHPVAKGALRKLLTENFNANSSHQTYPYAYALANPILLPTLFSEQTLQRYSAVLMRVRLQLNPGDAPKKIRAGQVLLWEQVKKSQQR